MPIDGATASFRPAGRARYFGAGFLSFWLCGWAAGEAFGAYFLVTLLMTIAGLAPQAVQGGKWLEGGAAFGGLLFILFWLSLWTFAGVAAITQLLRSLAGEDRIDVHGTAIEITRRAGPFSRVKSHDRSDIRAIRLRQKDQAVMIDTTTASSEITKFGTAEERKQLVEWLHQRLALPATPPAALSPRGWTLQSESGTTQMTRMDPRTRWIAASIAWVVAAISAMSWFGALASGSRGGAAVALAITAALTALALWLTAGVSEWRVRPGQLTYRMRFLLWTRERAFQGAQLKMAITTDSDGDRHYKLQVSDAHGSKTIASEMNDDADTRELGQWLSARSGFPLT